MDQLLAGAQPACAWLLPVQSKEGARVPEGSNKRRAVGEAVAREAVAGGGQGSAGPLRAAVALLLKGYLQNCQEIRELIGVCYFKWKMGLNDPVTKAMKASNTNYAEMAKANADKDEGNKTDLGPPFIQTFAALIKSLYEDDRVKDRDRVVLYKWFNRIMVGAKREDLELWVKSCRIKDCWAKAGKKKDDPKVSFRLSLCYRTSNQTFTTSVADESGEERTVEESLIAALEAAGATRDVGPPPRGALEREAQKLLDKHFAEGGDKGSSSSKK